MSHVDYWESMYERPLDELPWEIKDPPQELVDYFAGDNSPMGEALDVGCGTGNFSFYLARLGFTVTGVDFSDKALRIAEETNKQLGLDARFLRGDVTTLHSLLRNKKFDFVLDYKVLHHLDDRIAPSYAQQFSDLLNPGGRLLIVCWSDKDKPNQPFAVGDFGNTMFYRTADGVRKLYKGLREVEYREVLVGKRLNHLAHCFVFEKS